MYLYVTKMTETLEEVELLLNRSSRQLKKPERIHYRFLKKQVQFTSVDYFKRLIQICHMSKHSLNFEVVPLTQLL